MYFIYSYLFVFIVLLVPTQQAAVRVTEYSTFLAQGAWPCDNTLFITPNSVLNLVSFEGNNAHFYVVAEGIGFQINGIGFNHYDNLLYGVARDGPYEGRLLKFNRLGNYYVLPACAGISSLDNYRADIDVFGIYWFYGSSLYAIDVRTNATQCRMLYKHTTSNDMPAGADLAFNPVSGVMVSHLGNDKVRITSISYPNSLKSFPYVGTFPLATNSITMKSKDLQLLGKANVNYPSGTTGSDFFTATGDFIVYQNDLKDKGVFWKINLNTGNCTIVGTGEAVNNVDGGACPFTAGFSFDITPRSFIRGSTITLKWTLVNLFQQRLYNLNILHDLPLGYQFLPQNSTFSVNAGSLCKAPVYSNANSSLNFVIQELHEGDTVMLSIVVRVSSDALTGKFIMQSILKNTPATIGNYMYSDDPTTAQLDDATAYSVVSGDLQIYEVSSGWLRGSATETVDFGSTAVGVPLIKHFLVWNRGNMEVNILNILSPLSAGWSFLDTFRTNLTLVPGASTAFDVKLNAEAKGLYNTSFIFANTDPSRNPFLMFFKGSVSLPQIGTYHNNTERYYSNCSKVIRFQNVKNHTFPWPTAELTIVNNGYDALHIQRVEFPDGFECDDRIEGDKMTYNGDTRTYRLKMDTRKKMVARNRLMKIYSNDPDDEDNPVYYCLEGNVDVPTISVSLNGNALTSNSSRVVDFGDFSYGSATNTQMTFTIKNTGTTALTIYSVTLNGSNFFLASSTITNQTMEVGSVRTFRVQVNTTNPGTFASSIVIVSNDPDLPVFVVSCRALVQASGVSEISVTYMGIELVSGKSEIGFGAVQYHGSSVLKTVTIANTGTAVLYIGWLHFPNGWTLSGSSPSGSSLTPSQNVSLTISMSTNTQSDLYGKLEIMNSDGNGAGDEIPYVLYLSGKVGLPVMLVQYSCNGSKIQSLSSNEVVDFGTTTVSNPVSCIFTIKNVGYGNLQLGSLVSTVGKGFSFGTAFPANSTIVSASNRTFSIILLGTSVGQWENVLQFTSNDVAAPTFPIQLHGEVNQLYPSMKLYYYNEEENSWVGLLQNDTITVASLFINQTKTINFRIQNSGESVLSISGLTLSGSLGAFGISSNLSANQVMPNTQTSWFSLSFSSNNTGPGIYSAALTILSNDFPIPNWTVTLKGNICEVGPNFLDGTCMDALFGIVYAEISSNDLSPKTISLYDVDSKAGINWGFGHSRSVRYFITSPASDETGGQKIMQIDSRQEISSDGNTWAEVENGGVLLFQLLRASQARNVYWSLKVVEGGVERVGRLLVSIYDNSKCTDTPIPKIHHYLESPPVPTGNIAWNTDTHTVDFEVISVYLRDTHTMLVDFGDFNIDTDDIRDAPTCSNRYDMHNYPFAFLWESAPNPQQPDAISGTYGAYQPTDRTIWTTTVPGCNQIRYSTSVPLSKLVSCEQRNGGYAVNYSNTVEQGIVYEGAMYFNVIRPIDPTDVSQGYARFRTVFPFRLSYKSRLIAVVKSSSEERLQVYIRRSEIDQKGNLILELETWYIDLGLMLPTPGNGSLIAIPPTSDNGNPDSCTTQGNCNQRWIYSVPNWAINYNGDYTFGWHSREDGHLVTAVIYIEEKMEDETIDTGIVYGDLTLHVFDSSEADTRNGVNEVNPDEHPFSPNDSVFVRANIELEEIDRQNFDLSLVNAWICYSSIDGYVVDYNPDKGNLGCLDNIVLLNGFSLQLVRDYAIVNGNQVEKFGPVLVSGGLWKLPSGPSTALSILALPMTQNPHIYSVQLEVELTQKDRPNVKKRGMVVSRQDPLAKEGTRIGIKRLQPEVGKQEQSESNDLDWLFYLIIPFSIAAIAFCGCCVVVIGIIIIRKRKRNQKADQDNPVDTV